MSKLVKKYMMRDYSSIFEGVDSGVLISIRGVDANTNNAIRQDLAKKDISITVIRNNLAKQAFEDSGLSALAPILEGPSALAFGADSVVEVAREIVEAAKDIELFELKGAVLDGELFEGEAGVERLSKFPTRDEAQAKVVTMFLSPAKNIVGAAASPAKNIAGILKTIQEKLEGGETIAKA